MYVYVCTKMVNILITVIVEKVMSYSDVCKCIQYPIRQENVYNNMSESDRFVLVQACLRAPHVVADEAKVAIVFTYFFFISFFFLSSTPSAFYPLRGISRA